MRKMTFAKRLSWLLMFYIFFISCEDKFDEHYEIPKWIKGNAWQTLEDAGNYSIFLTASEKAGFKDILNGKNIVTAMVPNNEAFEKYIKEKGRNSINDFSEEELKKLIGFHLLYYTFSKDRLINFRPEGDGITEDQAAILAGCFYKHRTRSNDPISYTTVINTSGEETTIAIYHFERFLPVFSYRMFQTKQIDPTYNYEYFYPNSTWTGSTGFNVSDASVTEYEIVIDNGYIYYIDRVLEPLETVYTELYSRYDKYSHFYDLYDQYSSYVEDTDLTYNYGDGETLYVHDYTDDMPKIAAEWPVLDYRNINELSYTSANVFAPSNEAFNNFFEAYWKPGGYTDLNDVDRIAISYILLNHVYTGSVVFPEQITRGDIESRYDTPIDFDVEKVSDRKMCVNGVFYGLDEIKIPPIFTAVSGAAFQIKEFSNFLYMLDASSLLRSLASTESQFITLMPTNTQMYLVDIFKAGNNLYTYSSDGEIVQVSGETMLSYVNLHFTNSDVNLLASGKQVIKSNLNNNYWYLKDGKITTNAEFNNLIRNSSLDPFLALEEVNYNGQSWSNGKVYKYGTNATPMFQSVSSGLTSSLALTQDASYPFYEFSSLLRGSGLANGGNGTLEVTNYMAFIPTNTALKSAITAGKIPGVGTDGSITDTEALAEYLRYYFVSMSQSGMSDYAYVGSGINRLCYTFADGTTAQLRVFDDGNRIGISNNDGSQTVYVIDTYDQFPFVYEDGGFHMIEDVIEYINN